jgi:hypothetical protein
MSGIMKEVGAKRLPEEFARGHPDRHEEERDP